MLVVGVEMDGEARAYPLRILNVHEIVNDEIAGRSIAVTYCPLCRSGLVFSRRVDGRMLTFGVSGKLLRSNLVMYDRGTGTYWSQIRAQVIVGRLVPIRLDLLPSAITTWEKWQRAHPDTLVLSRHTGIYPPGVYNSTGGGEYRNSSFVGYGVGEVDDRLPTKEIVYGIATGGAAKAYPREAIVERGIINDEVGGIPVAVVEDPRDGSVDVYIREAGGRTFAFAASNGTLIDREGDRWSYDGEALSGPHEGTQLKRIDTHGIYWFAWSSFHPETGVYDEAGSS